MGRLLSDNRHGGVTRGLYMMIKYYLQMKGLMSTLSGGISSLAVFILVSCFIQNHPKLKNSDLNPLLHLGNLFMDFLEFYGFKFDYKKFGIN